MSWGKLLWGIIHLEGGSARMSIYSLKSAEVRAELMSFVQKVKFLRFCSLKHQWESRCDKNPGSQNFHLRQPPLEAHNACPACAGPPVLSSVLGREEVLWNKQEKKMIFPDNGMKSVLIIIAQIIPQRPKSVKGLFPSVALLGDVNETPSHQLTYLNA